MRTIIPLSLSEEDKSPKSLSDKELKKAFTAILERSRDGLQDEEDIAFCISRRDYLNDEQLKIVTGKTYDEIENPVADIDLNKLTIPVLTEKAKELGIELTGDEKKADIIALIESKLAK